MLVEKRAPVGKRVLDVATERFVKSPLSNQLVKWDEILGNPQRSLKILFCNFKLLEIKPF